MELDLPSPLAVVCHDAGASNLIFPWIKRWDGVLQPYMRGPAATLWMKHFPEHAIKADLPSAMRGASALLTGTGWASDLEHLARVEAARREIRSIAVIDHWVNYSARFERDGFCQLPDEIWVTDVEAEAIAQSAFPQTLIVRKENLYIREQLLRIGPPPSVERMLYVLEPVRNRWNRDTPGEFQSLDYALSRLSEITSLAVPTLSLRIHPSEVREKYQSYVDRFEHVVFDPHSDLAEAISSARVVLGVESFALALAFAAGRRVYSTLPPWAPAFRLPHKGIIQIRNIQPVVGCCRRLLAGVEDEESIP